MTIRRTSHAIYDTCYHLVWCPKYRKKIFEREDIRERAVQVIRRICEEYDFDIIDIQVETEHVHVLVSFPPKRSIGEVVRVIKSISARTLFREFPSLKGRLWAGELWEDGYFARTVGDRMTRDVIERYIEHHRDLKQGPAQLNFKLR
jgi:putative transposase